MRHYQKAGLQNERLRFVTLVNGVLIENFGKSWKIVTFEAFVELSIFGPNRRH